MSELPHIPDRAFSLRERFELRTIGSGPWGDYAGFPQIRNMLYVEEQTGQEFAERRNAQARKQGLLDDTYYAAPGGPIQRRELYNGSGTVPASADAPPATQPDTEPVLTELPPPTEVAASETAREALSSLTCREVELVNVGGNL